MVGGRRRQLGAIPRLDQSKASRYGHAMSFRRRIRAKLRWEMLQLLKDPGPKPPSNPALMGRHSYDPPIVHYYQGDTARVRVGAFTSIGLDVEFLPGGNHNPARVTTF